MQKRIEIEQQGATYTGQYSVEGINKRQLVVYYKGTTRVDSFDPRAEQPGHVEFLAERLLLEMIDEEAAGAEARAGG
jgi:hypothetical protein